MKLMVICPLHKLKGNIGVCQGCDQRKHMMYPLCLYYCIQCIGEKVPSLKDGGQGDEWESKQTLGKKHTKFPRISDKPLGNFQE